MSTQDPRLLHNQQPEPKEEQEMKDHEQVPANDESHRDTTVQSAESSANPDQAATGVRQRRTGRTHSYRNPRSKNYRSTQPTDSQQSVTQQSAESEQQPRESRPQDSQTGSQQPGQPQQQRPYNPQHEQRKVSVDAMTLNELNHYARRLGIVGATLMNKEELVKKIKFVEANPDFEMEIEGVLEKLPDGFGFLRSGKFDYVSGPDDIYVSPSQIRRFNLRTGDTVTGVIRRPKEGEKYFALLKVNKVNFGEPALTEDRPNFDRLTPLHPEKKFKLEHDPANISTRVMDLFTPIGKGQRGLIEF